MAKQRGEGPVTLSVLDRLIDDEPKNSQEVPLTRAQSLRELKISLRRDLEWLLNSRQPVDAVPDSCPETRDSVFNYGLPDISSANLGSPRERQRLSRAIEYVLSVFEPRLANVRVALVSTSTEKIPQIRFAIEGMLRIDPAPEHVSFDTLLELSSGEYKVTGEPGAR